MEFITHPMKFVIDGYIIQACAPFELSEEQAEKVARLFFRTHKFKKKDRGKFTFIATWTQGGDFLDSL